MYSVSYPLQKATLKQVSLLLQVLILVSSMRSTGYLQFQSQGAPKMFRRPSLTNPKFMSLAKRHVLPWPSDPGLHDHPQTWHSQPALPRGWLFPLARKVEICCWSIEHTHVGLSQHGDMEPTNGAPGFSSKLTHRKGIELKEHAFPICKRLKIRHDQRCRNCPAL